MGLELGRELFDFRDMTFRKTSLWNLKKMVPTKKKGRTSTNYKPSISLGSISVNFRSGVYSIIAAVSSLTSLGGRHFSNFAAIFVELKSYEQPDG